LRILYVEPFEAGSHAAFGAALRAGVEALWTTLTLPGRHWKWRMRGAALCFAERDRERIGRGHDLLLCSSFTPLADLCALAPELAPLPKAVVFHENQWTYPVRDERERDHHFGVTQLVTAAVADLCLFNSQHNRDGFLRGVRDFVARMPDARPTRTVAALGRRCEVVPLPVDFDELPEPPPPEVPPGPARARGPLIVWNHRWEHDKAPELFFEVLGRLAARGLPFEVAVLGARYRDAPPAFAGAREQLGARIRQWGPVAERAAYVGWLGRAQLAVSTARHEFFGLSMLEACAAGACPLVPDGLAYPELFPADHRYRSIDELEARLAALCADWTAGRIDLRRPRPAITAPVAAARVGRAWDARLRALVARHRPGAQPPR
jgi:glycosyltransferase involved in cell wall biosynthesis